MSVRRNPSVTEQLSRSGKNTVALEDQKAKLPHLRKRPLDMANSDVQTEKPSPQQTTWDGARRWSAALGLTAAVAMGSPAVACGSHGKTAPTTTTTITTTTTTTTTAPAPGDHHRDGGDPVAPAPGGAAPGATVTQTVPSPPTYLQPPYQAPGDYSPFGGHDAGPRRQAAKGW